VAEGSLRPAKLALADAGKECAGLSEQAVRTAVETLHGDLSRRSQALDKLSALKGTIDVSLASAEDSDAAMDELASGDVGVWNDEVDGLARAMDELQEERDAAIKAATTARAQIDQIERSADIPRLQEQCESLKAELADLVHEYRVVSTARALIADTLTSYVRERVPGILHGHGWAMGVHRTRRGEQLPIGRRSWA